MPAIEREEKYRRPGQLLLTIGIGAAVLNMFVGGILGALLWPITLFGIIGGLFLLITKKS